MNCPECRHSNPDGAKFCNNCAAEMILKCLDCGTELDAEDRFCYACGKPVEQATESQPQAPAVATEQPTIEPEKEPEPEPEPEATNMSENEPVEIEVEPEEITELEDKKEPEPATGLKYLRAHTKSPEELRKQPKLGAHAAHAKVIKELRKQPKEELRKLPKLGAHAAHAKALEEIRAERIKMPATTSPNPLNPKYPLSKPTVIRPIIRRPIVKQSVEVYERAQRKRIAIIIFSIIIALVALVVVLVISGRVPSTPLKETEYFKTMNAMIPPFEIFAARHMNSEYPASNIEVVRTFHQNLNSIQRNWAMDKTHLPTEYKELHYEFLFHIENWLPTASIAISDLKKSQEMFRDSNIKTTRTMHVADHYPLSCIHMKELSQASSTHHKTENTCKNLERHEQEIERLYLRFYAIADVEVYKADLRGYKVITIP